MPMPWLFHSCSFTVLLGSFLASPTTVFAQDDHIPPSNQTYPNCYSAVVLQSTSNDTRYNHKIINSPNSDLRILQDGSGGVDYSRDDAEFGWNSNTSTLALKRQFTIPVPKDQQVIDTEQPRHEWIPLWVSTQSGSGLDNWFPDTGFGAPFFPNAKAGRFNNGPQLFNDRITGSELKATLVANQNGKIGVLGFNGTFVSRWYACDNEAWGSGISWYFGESEMLVPKECTALNITKVDVDAVGADCEEEIEDSAKDLGSDHAKLDHLAVQSGNAASRPGTSSLFGLLIGLAMAAYVL